jgi:hypothetical protein
MSPAKASMEIPPGESLARLDPQALLAKAIETNAGIDTLERLVALAKDLRAIQAREAWYAAMAEFQRTCPPIKKTKQARIPTPRGSFTYAYAPLDEIMSVVQPILGPLGLSVSWRAGVQDRQVIASCRVAHSLGHVEESGDLAMPIVIAEDNRGASPAQRVAIATTYAKRYALMGILGLAPEDDDDGGSEPVRDEGPRPEDEAQLEREAAERIEEQKDMLLGRIEAGFELLKLRADERVRLWEKHVPGVEFKTVTAATQEQLQLLLGELHARHKDKK